MKDQSIQEAIQQLESMNGKPFTEFELSIVRLVLSGLWIEARMEAFEEMKQMI